MKNKISMFIGLTLGAAVGSVVTWKLVKTKYEKIAQEEIQVVRDAFAEYKKCCEEPTEDSDCAARYDEAEEETTDYDSEEYKSAVRNMKEVLENGGYVDYSKYDEKGGTDSIVDSPDEPRPKVISPDEYGEDEDYDQVSLTYFSDGVIMDEWNRLYDDEEIDESIGADFASYFGKYEEDSVYIRNDVTQTYYEILADVRTFEEASATWLYPGDNK